MTKALSLFASVVLLTGCMPEDGKTASSPEETTAVVSLLGEALPPVVLPEDTRIDFEGKLAAAQADFDADPNSLEATIWLGRRLAYLGRYGEAIDVYSRGLDGHPEEPRLHRHRGHRYITTRRLDLAVADFEKAAALIEGSPDQVEPDGLPNAAGIPTSTLHSNIWYHLGLAYYLQGNFEKALEAYEESLVVSKNPDMLVATTHWLYMTLRRLGLEERAQDVLAPISIDMEVIENHEYLQLLLMYLGEIPAGEIWPSSGDGVSSAASGYGVGNWHLVDGRTADAEAVFRQILQGEQWAAFGYIAAEAELARSDSRDSV